MVRSSILAVLATGISSVVAQTAVSSAVFNNIVKYTKYAAAAYAEDCPSPPGPIIQTLNFSSVDNKATLFRDNAANAVVLAFRGSAFVANLDQDFIFNFQKLNISNTKCSTCQVHAGFQSVYNVMSDSVNSAVKSALAQYSGASLIVTGHSLGGALASLSATSLAAGGLKPTVYSFGEPRNGNAAFSTYVNGLIPNYFRVTHYNDGVPQIPPTLLGYQHHGTEYWESKQSGNTAASTFKCPGAEPTTCDASLDYGNNPINGAHINYSNFLVASVLYNAGCGYVLP